MADRRQLAQGLMMMTPAMREDLAGREQDIQRGKTVELLRRAGKEMYENPIVNTAVGLSPVLGDIQAGVEAYRSAQAGDWGNAGLNAAGMLPFIPMLGKTALKNFPEGMLGKTDMFETGNPATFEYIRNTEKSPYMGEKFGQDIEPAGRYLSYKDPVVNMESMPSTWETGQVSFNNPLVVNFGESYGTPTNWKNMLSESFGGKTGKDLSKAISESGYDGIVTVDKYGTSEIVDLSNFLERNGTPLGNAVRNFGNPTLEQFKSMASSGKIRQAKTEAQEIEDLLSGKSKFAEVNWNWDDPDVYDKFDELAAKGYKAKQADDYRTTFLYQNPEDITPILNAKNPVQYGTAYGYSPEDISAFYLNRRQAFGNPDLEERAYKEYLQDLAESQK